MKQSETHEYQPRTKEYSDQLNGVIRKFFHDIPVFPNTSEEIKQKRLQIIVDFVDKIDDLFIFINDEDYYDKVEREIEKCLRKLPMWEPKSNQDKLEFKSYLEDRLFTLIKTFNKKWHNFKIKRKDNMENEINLPQNYLESTTEKGAVSKKLMNKIKRILESGINEKHIMREEIVNILEELSPYMQLPHDKDVNILAGDLTKLLSDSEEKYETSDEYKSTRDNSSNDYQLGEKAEDEIINEITNVLFNYDDLNLLSNKRNVVKEIRRILKLSGGFSDSESSSLAKTLMTNVRGCFDEDLYTKNGGRSHSSSFLVLTSEQDLSEKSDPPFHSTPKNHVRKKEISTLNKAQKVFIEPQMQRNVDGLAENLKDRIVKLPHDATLNRVYQKRIDKQNEDIETEDKLNEFVDKHIRRYNIDDDVVNGVLKIMLYRELYKLSPASREELYINSNNDAFNTDEFRKELEIASEIHDWLKNIPFYYPLLKPGRETIEFVHILARNIANIELERIKYPNKMNYNWLHTQIATYMLQKEAAIANDEDKLKIDHYAGQLYMRIINLRKDEENTDELCKIITEHMKKYDTLLAKDYLKKILWRRRLADNVKKLLLAKPTASRVDVEKALAMISLPHDDSVFKYKMEIKYNITIHDWLHALPLLPPKDNEEEHRRKNKIQELLQKIIEADERKAGHPHDTQIDDDLDNYIASWISQLQFEEDADIIVPVMISQLRSGLEYIKWTEIQPKETSEHGLTRSRQHSKICSPKQKDPGEQMVEAIENWCNNLPIKEENNEATKAKKERTAINIFQILGSLNDDSRLDNDNQKLKNILDNEIKAQLENLSEHKGINKNKEKLKADLVNKIMEIKTMIRDITAGDDYVQTLENTIDASLPNPHHRSPKYDLSYELFKKRMVMLWLLENYDYAVDYHSMKYKKMLAAEVRSLSEEVQNKNLFPADKDEMMNDIMSALYTTNPPTEDAIVDEIENIKLRCEIEIWANELPLKEASNYNKVWERDQILTILSKLLFDIVKREECDADEKMRLEIIKWTQKLPLMSEEKTNVAKYAELLMCFLKATADSRKCQRQPEPKNLTVVEKTLTNLKSDDAVLSKTNQGNTSQIAEPSNPKSCGGCGSCGASLEQLTFLINKSIINWCIQLPLRYGVCDEHNVVQSTKELISQRLFRFVSVLNYRPNTLNNEGLYESHLNLEIERILSQLANDRAYWEEQRSRNERKYQLINALKAIRPLVQEVKDRELYKEKLKHTISSFHEPMAQHSGVELSENTQRAILDDFIQYSNHKGDFENQELYKLKINDALKNELNEDVDPLLTANRLICELSKVEFPAQSAKQRRYSEPNPIGLNNLPSASALRRHSLPPLQNSYPRFVKSQPQGPPLSTSLPAPRCQRPPDFRRSLPLTSEAFPPPLSQELPVLYRASALDIRPFPLPPPELNMTNNSHVYQSPCRGPQTFYRGQENQQNPVREFAEQSFKEREPILEHQMPSEKTGARVITTARARNGPRSSSECPEERQGLAGQEYCETCDKDDDCAYFMPYSPRMDYMYF
ncbi:uncharacterized protein LOC134752578 [Cydia strobilella]|uniref:uncharacterized protein LOC134752578 n=1 Tax=Cydia strobilella TaxID=1100964 RepID=UPI0030048162